MSDFSVKSIDARTIANSFDYNTIKRVGDQKESLQVNNATDKNIGKDEHTKQTTEGETVVGAEGTSVARNLIGVTQAGNADGNQDQSSDDSGRDTLSTTMNIKDLTSKHPSEPLDPTLNFDQKVVMKKLSSLGVNIENAKDLNDLIKSKNPDDINELKNILNNTTKIAN